MKYLVQQALSHFLALPVNEITWFDLQYGYNPDSISISFFFYPLSFRFIWKYNFFWNFLDKKFIVVGLIALVAGQVVL